ncbi:expressed unknown protein [Seminavis robusta]|uniref:Uncharacterized protein n=1 Tax=Seminavis robusta TaxID=568900 RepID=A0A9N8EZA7_9STRA|nr:expressed unknown protein [Seminavis robusta]|eukprot:Sro2200_g318800.1 n/a (99) ;mRNA; r:290-586
MKTNLLLALFAATAQAFCFGGRRTQEELADQNVGMTRRGLLFFNCDTEALVGENTSVPAITEAAYGEDSPVPETESPSEATVPDPTPPPTVAPVPDQQ